MKCPECETIFQPTAFQLASALGSITSPAKEKARKKNLNRKGRPLGAKNKPKPISAKDAKDIHKFYEKTFRNTPHEL